MALPPLTGTLQHRPAALQNEIGAAAVVPTALHREHNIERACTGAVQDLPAAVPDLPVTMRDSPEAACECTTAERSRSMAMRGVPMTVTSATMAGPRSAAGMLRSPTATLNMATTESRVRTPR